MITDTKLHCPECMRKIWGFMAFTRDEVVDATGTPKNSTVGLMLDALRMAVGIEDSSDEHATPACSQTVDQLRGQMVGVMNAFNQTANTNEVEVSKRHTMTLGSSVSCPTSCFSRPLAGNHRTSNES
jgi:hypothetical protein